MTFFFPLPAQTMVGTDLVHALILSAFATLGHLQAGRVDVLLGARVAHVIPERALRTVLAVILIGLGLPIAWPGAFTHVQAG